MKKRRVGRLNLLTARQIQSAGDGEHNDGGGLILRVRDGAAVWVFRFTSPAGKRREMGLGTVFRDNLTLVGESLTLARKQASEARALLADGVDPIDRRQAERARKAAEAQSKKAEAKRDHLTLARAARSYHERFIEPKKTPKHSAQWISSLENHVKPELWHKPIAEITAPELFDFLVKVQDRVPETARRMLQRLCAVFDEAMFRNQCAGNPARAIKNRLSLAAGLQERGNFAALDYRKAPAFITRLRAVEGIAARCFEFAILTAARTGEAIGATWSEFDLDAGIWTVPASRMKSSGKKKREEHAVFLPPRAVEIVKAQAGLDARYVFPSTRLDGKPLSNMAMLMTLRRLDADKATTVHGLCRATFSTWANENGKARPQVIEACLAHRESDQVKAAYNRATFNDERKALLSAWADYLSGVEPASNVLQLKTA